MKDLGTQELDHTIFRPERVKKRVERYNVERVEPKKRGVKKFDLEKRGIYEVDRILNMRRRKGKSEYLIKWRGYDNSENTWENEKNIPELLIKKYLTKIKN